MKKISYALMLLLFFATVAFSQNSALNGKWKLINAKSSFLDYYREMTLEFSVGKSETSIITKMGPKRRYEEKLVLKTDGKANSIEIADGTFADNIHMGLRLPLGKKKEVKAVWEKDNSLNVNEKYDLFASQGVKKSEVTYSFELSPY